MRRPLGVLLAATLATPAALHASPNAFFWQALCSAGAVRACASIMVRAVPIDAQNNYVEVWIRNLQGFDNRDNTGGSIFTNFALNLPNSPWSPGFSADMPRLGSVGSVGGSWGSWDGSQAPGGYTVQAYRPGDGVRGCDPAGGVTLITCAAQGFDGWATINTFSRPDMNGPYNWDTTGAFYQVYGATTDGTVFSIDFPANLAIVTPEPSSIVLLATGLALVGAAAWRRRRRA